jgi:Tfp pilus assembly protein PilO
MKNKININLDLSSVFSSIASYLNSIVRQVGREKLIAYLYTIFTLFSVSFFILFAINPTLSAIFDLKRQYEDNLLIYQSLKKKIAALSSLNLQYQQLQPDIPLILDAIPESPESASFTRRVEKIAIENNVKIDEFSLGAVELFPAPKKDKDSYSFSFNLKVSGSSDNINKFILDLINLDRVVTINSLNTTQEKDQKQISLGGKIYFNR